MNARIVSYDNLRSLILILLMCIGFDSKTQTTLETISVPSTDGGGAMIGDIIHANDYIFIYSLDKLTIYDAETNNYVDEITFPYQPNLIDDQNGKFNPIHFNELYNVPAANMMVHNPNANVLYVVTPELRILTIDVTDPNFSILSNYSPSTQQLPDYFKPLNGMNLIKFDHDHNRLYWVVTAKDINSSNNCTGQFHSMIRFFAIFKTNEYSGDITEYYFDSLATSATYEQTSIFDIEFNRENDLFYLANMSLLSVYRVTDDGGPDKIELECEYFVDLTTYGCSLYKFGKLIYINETYPPNNKIHKIIALPYRYLDYPLNNADIFMIDGDLNDPIATDWETFPSPSKRIMDGIFHAETEKLVLTYSPNPDDILPSPPPSQEQFPDIAVFSYDFNNSTFTYPPVTIISDNSQQYSEIYDRNYSSHLHQVDASNILISKKDEIVRLEYSGGYAASQVLSAEGNIFLKGVRSLDNDNSYIINAMSNGVEVIDEIHNYTTTSILNGYAVNHIVSDAFGEKLYLFNKLNAFNTGCYIYEDGTTYNINNPFETKISAPIGDCLYNPYLNHFIISENAYFSEHAARIKVFDNDINNTLITDVPLTYEENENSINAYYATKMFLSPDEKLYVFANMRYNEYSNPRIFILNAYNNEFGAAYQILNSFEVENFPIPGGSYPNEFDFYNAYFCYNPYNQSVYATLSPNEFVYGPYSTVPNSMYEFHDLFSDPTGLLIKVNENGLVTNPLNYPGKIICPDSVDSQYYGKMFIIGRKFFVISNPTDEIIPSDNYNQVFNDIIYSPVHDQIFALRDTEGTCGPHRKIQIYEINAGGGGMSFNQVVSIDGQATCLFNNSFDGKIYFHQKYDEEKLGDVPVKLWSFRYEDGAIQNLSSVDLGFTSVYPDVNHDGDKHLYLYNITTPAIDPYNNVIYIPNGGHSKLSKISFAPNESMLLNNETWTWFSIPRMERDNNNEVDIYDALSNDNLDAGLYIAGTELRNIPLDELSPISNFYQGSQWSITDPLKKIVSTRGYKINFQYAPNYTPPDRKWLHMQGTVLDPVDGYENLSEDPKENWLGYYLYQEQSPFDAISEDDLDHIYSIKGQYWACGKFWGDGIPVPYWVCQCFPT